MRTTHHLRAGLLLSPPHRVGITPDDTRSATPPFVLFNSQTGHQLAASSSAAHHNDAAGAGLRGSPFLGALGTVMHDALQQQQQQQSSQHISAFQ